MQTNNEILKLRRELAEEHDKVLNLSSQLVTNSHVVSAFEQSLVNNLTFTLKVIVAMGGFWRPFQTEMRSAKKVRMFMYN